MSIPKTGSRRIDVDDAIYRWRVRSRPTYAQGNGWLPLTVAVECEAGGRALVLVFAGARPDNWLGQPIEIATPAVVAASIRQAIAAGWRTQDSGGPAFFSVATRSLKSSIGAVVEESRSPPSPEGSWQPYNPEWLVALASAQQPNEVWLPAALRQCQQARPETPAYIHFVEPSSSAWKFERNVVLESEEHGTLVLDVLEGHMIGGLEFLNRL